MTVSPSAPTTPPQRLSFVVFPLLFTLILNAVELLLLPFQGQDAILASYDLVEQMMGVKLPVPTQGELQQTLWGMFFITAAIILFLYLTRRAVLEGRRWGWVASLVVAVISLLFLPIGTVMGVVMLIGLFDREVRAYLTR